MLSEFITKLRKKTLELIVVLLIEFLLRADRSGRLIEFF